MNNKAYHVKLRNIENDDLSEYHVFFKKQSAISKAKELTEYYLSLCGVISSKYLVIFGKYIDYLVDTDSVMNYIKRNIKDDYSIYCANYFDITVEEIEIQD